MDRSEGFPAIVADDARILILGSLPGDRSIAAGQYYAHPQNAFWPIMFELFAAEGDYATRCDALLRQGIALWDVLRASVRPGSLDASIRIETANANDFDSFFRRHPDIELVVFNGRKAEQLFRRFVVLPQGVRSCGLPSTSPAYASLPVSGKLAQWRQGLSPRNHERRRE